MHVFWRKGFDGASVADLTLAMGIQPASLYAAFGNKQAVFEQALARYLAGPVAFMSGALDQPTAYEVASYILRGSAEFLTQSRPRAGCMTIQSALVGDRASAPVRRKLTALRVKSQERLRQRFERAQTEGDLPKDADAAALARFVTTVFQGMTIQAIDGATRQELLQTVEMALRVWPNQACPTLPLSSGLGSDKFLHPPDSELD